MSCKWSAIVVNIWDLILLFLKVGVKTSKKAMHNYFNTPSSFGFTT